jgi:hypothetical protein
VATEPTTEPKLITDHDCGWIDHVRTAIFALQLASELSADEAKIKAVREVTERLQTFYAEYVNTKAVPA